MTAAAQARPAADRYVAEMKDLVVYYSPSCAFSAGTVAFLLLRGADARLVNLDEHEDDRARLTEQLAGRKLETPTLEVGGEVFVAPSLSDLKDMLATWGLPDEASPHAQIADAHAD